MQQAIEIAVPRPWYQEKLLMGLSLREYVRSLVTPFNAVAGASCWWASPLSPIGFTTVWGPSEASRRRIPGAYLSALTC